jgi:hypothetical protein
MDTKEKTVDFFSLHSHYEEKINFFRSASLEYAKIIVSSLSAANLAGASFVGAIIFASNINRKEYLSVAYFLFMIGLICAAFVAFYSYIYNFKNLEMAYEQTKRHFFLFINSYDNKKQEKILSDAEELFSIYKNKYLNISRIFGFLSFLFFLSGLCVVGLVLWMNIK